MNALIKIYFLAITFALPLVLNAAYLTNVPVTVTQPDGIVLNIFATGDEFYNWLHDENGFTIVQNQTTGFYCYADLIDEELLPTDILPGVDDPKNNGLLPNINLPPELLSQTIDIFTEDIQSNIKREDFLNVEEVTINNIVVYIRFADDDEFPEEQQKYANMFNTKGDSLNTVANYFKEASYDQLDVHSTFYPTNDGTLILSYQDSMKRENYTPFHATRNPNGYKPEDRDTVEHTLVANAVNFIKDQIPQELDIDFNNDGKVDNVSFVIKGYETDFSSLLWPHRWSIKTKYNSFINGKRVEDYIFLIEYYNDVGVICHEIMHVLGAPDLYHYFYTYSSPVNRWDVMGRNILGYPPQYPSGYIKYKYCGWIPELFELTTSNTYPINSPLFAKQFNCYKLPLKNTDEYLIIEYRQKAGIFESSLPGEGLIIYRINEKIYGNFDRKIFTEIPGGILDEVYAFRPGGSPSNVGQVLNANFSSNFNRTEFNNTTDPYCFTSDSSECLVSIYDISAAGDNQMTFSIDFCDNSDVTYNSNSIVPPITEAVNIITNGTVLIQPTTNITFEAANEILLNGGFETKSGSNFTAKISICGEE